MRDYNQPHTTVPISGNITPSIKQYQRHGAPLDLAEAMNFYFHQFERIGSSSVDTVTNSDRPNAVDLAYQAVRAYRSGDHEGASALMRQSNNISPSPRKQAIAANSATVVRILDATGQLKPGLELLLR